MLPSGPDPDTALDTIERDAARAHLIHGLASVVVPNIELQELDAIGVRAEGAKVPCGASTVARKLIATRNEPCTMPHVAASPPWQALAHRLQVHQTAIPPQA